MFMRVHRQGAEVIVALCDAELMGKVLKGDLSAKRKGATFSRSEKVGGEAVLDLKKYGEFYKGEKMKLGGTGKAGKKGEASADEKKVVKALGEATSINAVGKKSVEAVRKSVEFAQAEAKLIGGVPHVQVYKV
ncbi:MAG: hypothetical protein Q7T16_03510 [Candidatus Burarchaeum sp.]|nr:hypothetical protein [Candidatus Burarchaeum sp.]MDO8339699.1 hypothetical protein [Candidatus Burarchaeum sp.]